MAMYIPLKEARENQMLSLQDLSAATGITVRTIQNWEIDCSKATYAKFMKLLKALHISPSHVYIGKQSKAIAEIAKYLETKKSPSTSRQEPLKVIS